MRLLVILCLAGAAGTLSRWWLSEAAYAVLGRHYPWGTSLVNVLGCLAFGLVWTLADERLMIRGELKLALLTGFMGAFTTFSTFVFESGELVRDGRLGTAALNAAAQFALGYAALLLGQAAGRWL